ncbi:hypothetical protein AWB64_01355 [Caballeronia sordidicola]|uniref:Uncharacterized protein n=1 Tax=Caballeronia sordidicola TaxID=196367 RepID=A0A158FKC3_CABSO|nr:hypothetical protein AWB64_01355 [Caballeronia sordidicola]
MRPENSSVPDGLPSACFVKGCCAPARLACRAVVVHRLMPDSAVNPACPGVSPALADGPAANPPAAMDSGARFVRAGRSAQRPTPPPVPYGAPTLDLFAEDAERAMLQALNTDIRQCMLPGFELPEVFMASVEAVMAAANADDHTASTRQPRRGYDSRNDDAATTASVATDGALNGELPFALPIA